MSTKKTSYHRGNLREALIETSLEVISDLGVRALTLREIGARLNVSRMAPYRHFADKSALLAAITAAGFRKFTEALETATRDVPDDFVSQSNALAIAYVRFSIENRAHFEVMFGGGGEPQYLDNTGKEVADRSFLVLEQVIRRGQEQGAVVDGDPTKIAQMLWACVHGVSTLRLGIGANSELDPNLILFHTQLLRKGLEPKQRP